MSGMHSRSGLFMVVTILGLAVNLPASAARAATLNVPSQYATIQAAIDAAQPGDHVVVADGVYTGAGYKNLDFHGKAITVRSTGGNPATCIIDCEGSGRGFHFHSGETAASLVDGFTIRNGYASESGGVYCYSSSPTLVNCIISENTASSGGGGVFCRGSGGPTLTNCVISGNTASGSIGTGGMLCIGYTNPALTNCTISGNTGSYCGGMYFTYSDPTLTNCTISGNIGSEGGGVVCCEASPILTNCTFNGNTASSGGGGALYACSDQPWINGPRSVYPACGSEDGSALSSRDSNPALTNCILWGDTPNEIHVETYSYAIVTCCDIQGDWVGTGNIDLDPLFADDNYRLSAGSPCLDAGRNSAVPSGILTDFDGRPRFVDDPAAPDCPYAPWICGTAPIVDMGAYEYQGVTPRGDLNCDGIVDVNDIAPFAQALIDPTGYATQYPGCPAARADLDESDTLDGLDIQPFVDALVSP